MLVAAVVEHHEAHFALRPVLQLDLAFPMFPGLLLRDSWHTGLRFHLSVSYTDGAVKIAKLSSDRTGRKRPDIARIREQPKEATQTFFSAQRNGLAAAVIRSSRT